MEFIVYSYGFLEKLVFWNDGYVPKSRSYKFPSADKLANEC